MTNAHASRRHSRSFCPRRAQLRVLVAAFVAAFALALAGAATASAATPTQRRTVAGHFNARTAARLARTLRRTWAATWSPGVIVGVWVGDRGWTATRGSIRRTAGPRPFLTEHTRIGSVTKTMIGTLILELVDQGKLHLDETIQRWFPELRGARHVTIRELGDMSSGIATYTANPAITDRFLREPTQSWKPNTLIAGGAALPRKFAPGKGFDYSDTNFVMLGQIAEKVTGEPLAKLLATMVYRPLGMNHTSYPAGNRLPRPFWHGYTIQGSEFGNALDATTWNPTFAAGSGAAISTLSDLHRWARAVGTGALLTPTSQRARLVPNPASEKGGRAYLFGLGADHGWLGHEGSFPGYNTELQYLPSLEATIVVLANSDIGNAESLSPASTIFSALARVIAPRNVPAR